MLQKLMLVLVLLNAKLGNFHRLKIQENTFHLSIYVCVEEDLLTVISGINVINKRDCRLCLIGL